jgi:hypothetical protein
MNHLAVSKTRKDAMACTRSVVKKSMTDNLQLGMFVAVILAFVVCGCLATGPTG